MRKIEIVSIASPMNDMTTTDDQDQDLYTRIRAMDAKTETTTKRSFRKNADSALRKIATEWHRLVSYMFEPEDGDCLAALRIAFGLLMMIDTMDERGFCQADKRWMEPNKCFFPLLDFVRPLPGRWMCLTYASMFFGIFGIFSGYHYRASCVIYAIPYWYIFLADKSSWNNHSYLFGLLIVIFSVTDSHHNWSVDRWLLRKSSTSSSVPRWNYLLFRIQFFIMYFVAGLKKFEPDWLWGYSMASLGHHHAFAQFRYFFSAEFVDHWIVHVGGFLIDLLSGFGLCFRSTRPFTIVVLLIFHGMNSIMFSIGMFPYVCAIMIPVFCDPKIMSRALRMAIGKDNKPMSESVIDEVLKSNKSIVDEESESNSIVDKESKIKPIVDEEPKPKSIVVKEPKSNPTNDYKPPTRIKQNAIVACIFAYTILQLFLPYSHFVTQGYNGWRNGMYGYSWDMMVYNMDVARIQVKVVDHTRREQYFLDPYSWTDNNKWVLHGDMIRQFAGCVAAWHVARGGRADADATNVSVYMDVWASLNGRFHQRMVDPTADVLHDPWTPWTPVPWLLPMLRQFDQWRPMIADSKNKTDGQDDQLLFFADFPGMTMTNYYYDNDDRNTTAEIPNAAITLAVLEGAVAVRSLPDDETDGGHDAVQQLLVSGEAMDMFGHHAVTTISATPSCYVLYSDATSMVAAATVMAVDDHSPRASRCSNACYAFAMDALKTAIFSIFSFSP